MVGSAGSSQLSTAIAPSPPSNSARGEDGNELYMDLSWQSSISALCSIGAAKAKSSDFDFLGGSFLDSPGQWSARSRLRVCLNLAISNPNRYFQAGSLSATTTAAPRALHGTRAAPTARAHHGMRRPAPYQECDPTFVPAVPRSAPGPSARGAQDPVPLRRLARPTRPTRRLERGADQLLPKRDDQDDRRHRRRC